MNLKIITLLLLILGMSINAGYGMFVRVSVGNSNGCPVYAVNDRPVTRSSLTNLLGKLGSLDKDVGIYVCVDKQASALSLVSAISDIQGTGLHTIILICPAVENGKTGAYQLSIDATKQLMSRGCCGGDGIESGFHESTSCSELVEVILKKDHSRDVRIEDKKVDLPSGSTMPVMAAVLHDVEPIKTESIGTVNQNEGVQAGPQWALQTWKSSSSTISQRWQAVTNLLTPGMTYSEVRKVLGDRTLTVRTHGMVIGGGGGTIEKWGWEYSFPDGRVNLYADGWQEDSAHPDIWTYRSAGYSGVAQPIHGPRANVEDDVKVTIE